MSYTHLTKTELVFIEEYHEFGLSIRKIARKLKRGHETIYRAIRQLKKGLTAIDITFNILGIKQTAIDIKFNFLKIKGARFIKKLRKSEHPMSNMAKRKFYILKYAHPLSQVSIRRVRCKNFTHARKAKTKGS